MKSFMRQTVLLALLTASYTYAANLDSLLEQYRSESELSKKTKDENAGHLIVFTRDDLERMQVETLKDVLKSTRVFRYLENRVGEPDMLNMDPILYSSKSIRVYLNDNELVMPITGSGFLLFGNMDMDFIDHVEIYEGFPSFEFAIEPATIVIKLYTKSAQRDAGSRVKALVGSHGTNKENIYTAGYTKNDIAYFAYANHKTNNREVQSVENESVKRDQKINHFYASFEKNKNKVELHAISSKADAFLGIFPYAVPKNSNLEHRFLNASFSTKSADESLSFKASYIYTDGKYDIEYSRPVIYGNYTTFHQKNKTDTLTLITKKKFTFKYHILSVGLQYRYKYFKFDDIVIDNVASPLQQKYDREDIYSLFLEDSIFITKNDLIGIAGMQQHYKRNKEVPDKTISQLRLSYVHSKEAWVAKTFLSRQELIPEPYTTAASHVGNPYLKPEVYASATQEVSYKNKTTLTRGVVGYENIKRFLIPNNTGVIQNSQKVLDIYFATAEFNYFFRKNDKVTLKADYTKVYGSDNNEDVHHYNYLARMLNTVGKFDIFNELVINKGFDSSGTGYDYSAGVKYRVTADFHVNLKGENIFDKGLTRKYQYHVRPPKYLEVPVIEQKFMLSMEYLF